VHDGGGCRDIAVGVEMLPVEDKTGVASQLLEEGALGPAVALAERVDGVDLTEVVGQPLGFFRFDAVSPFLCPFPLNWVFSFCATWCRVHMVHPRGADLLL
jgi:hypothetical protein